MLLRLLGRILLSLFCDNFSLTAVVPVIFANKFRQVSEKFGENSVFAKLLRQNWRNLFAKTTGACENDDVLSNQKIPYRESENDRCDVHFVRVTGLLLATSRVVDQGR